MKERSENISRSTVEQTVTENQETMREKEGTIGEVVDDIETVRELDHP